MRRHGSSRSLYGSITFRQDNGIGSCVSLAGKSLRLAVTTALSKLLMVVQSGWAMSRSNGRLATPWLKSDGQHTGREIISTIPLGGSCLELAIDCRASDASRVKKPKVRKLIRLPAPKTDPVSTLTSTSMLPIRFSVNIIAQATADRLACFVAAGSPSPYRSLDEIPEAVRAFVLQPGDEPGPIHDDTPQLNYTLGTLYSLDADDRRRAKSVEREILNLQRAQEEQEAWEEYLAREPDEAVKAALADAHAAGSGLAIAQAQYAAKEAEMSAEHARQFVEEDSIVDDGRISPAIEPRAAI